jgi:hypothetical protein
MTLAAEAPSQRVTESDKAALGSGGALRVMRDVSKEAAGAAPPQMVTVDADHAFSLPNADADCVFCQSVRVVAAAVGRHSIVANVTYTNERNMVKTASATFIFTCHSPFTVGASVAGINPVQMLTGMAQPQAASVMLNTAVMLGVTLTVASPDSLVINSACLVPNPAILSAPQANAALASDSISPLHSVDEQIAAKGAEVVLPFLVAFRSYSSASCGTLRLVWQRAHAPAMQPVAASLDAVPPPAGSAPADAAPLLDGSVIPSSQWLKTHAPNSMSASPVNFRAPMPCPACYSSNFSIDLLLPNKVPLPLAPAAYTHPRAYVCNLPFRLLSGFPWTLRLF